MNESSNTTKNREVFREDEDLFVNSSSFANTETSFRTKTTMSYSNNVNKSLQNSTLNVSALCCDEEISGYDKLAGRTWIYPTNYPVRHYQFNIIQATIVKNTLVSLPTGLGKTFIAAVIMYNFYRWYPLGKIIFTAPTRPLVAQQIDACYNIVAIPSSDTIEMTGNTPVNIRKVQWKNKRVVFATPQVIYNDIQSGICPSEKIRCIVFDEAHRAKGNYAYCQIISTLTNMGHKTYRVLALSATPGSRIEDVIKVVKNLHIAHLELRSENCLDVAPYTHSRKINTTVIQLGAELTQLRNQYIEILDSYAQRLKQLHILPQNVGNLSKGRIVMLYKEYQNRERGSRHPQHNYIMKDFTLLISLFHGLELLIKHGSRVFLNFFDEHPEKSWIESDSRLTAFFERLRDDLGINPLLVNCSILPDGSIPQMPHTLCFGHPKFDILRKIMLEHFNKYKEQGQETKAIVFCEYRESVNLVHCLLLQCRPLIKAQMFVGQGAGKVSQKQQLRVMRGFREGEWNTLVATCVAEEGLDVGSVDLIICFDTSTRSPVRLVQRCGRTGRERGGQVYILVTEGREHQILMDCMRQRDSLNQKILNSKDVENNLYKFNPRMIPHEFTPECQKMHITVVQKSVHKKKTQNKKENTEKTKKGQMDLRNILGKHSSSINGCKKEKDTCSLISQDEFQQLFPEGFQSKNFVSDVEEVWTCSKDQLKLRANKEKKGLDLTTWLEWQRTLQPTFNIGHSADTEILTELLQYSDAKRFELPASTQNPTFNTQTLMMHNLLTSPVKHKKTANKIPKKKQKAIHKSPSKKDGDIRALFNTATKSTKDYTKLVNELGIQNDENVSTMLIDLLVELSISDVTVAEMSCHLCHLVCNCKLLKNINEQNEKLVKFDFLLSPNHPDISLLEDLCSETFTNFIEKNNYSLDEDCDKLDISMGENNCSSNFTLELEFLETSPLLESLKIGTSSDKNFDIGDIEDIFADSLPGEDFLNTNTKTQSNDLTTSDQKNTLNFFGLESVEDIFADSDDAIFDESNANSCYGKNLENTQHINSNTDTNLVPDRLSPSILSDIHKRRPALTLPTPSGTLTPKRQCSIKKAEPINSTLSVNIQPRRLLEHYSVTSSNELILNENMNNKNSHEKNHTSEIPAQADFDNTKSLLSITQLVHIINKSDNEDVTAIPPSNLEKNLNQNAVVHDTKNFSILMTETSKDIINKKSNSPILSTQPVKNVVNSRSDSPILFTEANKSDSHDRSNSQISLIQADKNIVNDKHGSPILSTYVKETLKSNVNNLRDSLFIPIETDKRVINDREGSPIFLTQADKKLLHASNQTTIEKETTNHSKRCVTILDSDSDFEDTVIDHVDNHIKTNKFSPKKLYRPLTPLSENPSTSKRKERSSDDEELSNFSSPYFTKRRKIKGNENNNNSLQDKVKAALKKNNQLNYMFFQQNLHSQKENIFPRSELCDNIICFNPDKKKSPKEKHLHSIIQKLQTFSQEENNLCNKLHTSITHATTTDKKYSTTSNDTSLEDSDEDFISNDKNNTKQDVSKRHNQKIETVINNHKIRKKAKQFLDLEAELSEASHDSGDELTDDSMGSIIDFICDENETLSQQIDMQAHYLNSVKSPIKGVFKIPQLPAKFDVCSQNLNDDEQYEMDSFCVDSHIGLTQINDVSELEIAEMRLEAKRRNRNRKKKLNDCKLNLVSSSTERESPVKQKTKRIKRQINSDSDDSS